MFSNRPLEDISAGAAQGVLSWTKAEIADVVQRFKHRNVSFIEDPETIQLAVQERKGPEWQLYSQYVYSRDLRVLLQMGLTLRKLESSPALQPLRDKIKRKYGATGLHIAEFVQNEIIGLYIGIMLGKSVSKGDLTNQIEKLLREIDKYVVFVKATENVQQLARDLNIRLVANNPNALIILGSGNAMRTAAAVSAKLAKQAVNFGVSRFEERNKIIVIFHRLDSELTSRQ